MARLKNTTWLFHHLDDGYGCNNNYIDFSYLFPTDEHGRSDIEDLGDVINELSE